MRFRLYLKDRLANSIDIRLKTTKIFKTKDNFLAFLFILYGDFNEARTAKLKLNRLR
jgi:hypothetical protein